MKYKVSLFTNPYGVILKTLLISSTVRDFFPLPHSQNIPISISVSSTSQFFTSFQSTFSRRMIGPCFGTFRVVKHSISLNLHKCNKCTVSLSLSRYLPLLRLQTITLLVSSTNFCPTEGIKKSCAVRKLHPPNNEGFHTPNLTYQFSAAKSVIILN